MSPILFKRLSDESLGSRLASGEAAAFDELYRRYINRLAAYGSHLLGDAASGDDVAQATLMKAYAALREGRVPDRMKPWLFRIAHNAAIDLVVRRRELPSGDLPDAPSIDREPFAGALVEALATLPDRQRRVYVLREVHGLRIDETSAELGLNASQVEQALFAARNRLAEQLVFGDRLNCVTVQRLAAGPLDAPERRALKTHLRTCDECRQTLGLRGRALSVFPSGVGFEWLRGLGVGLIGGGAPAAAKVGAVFATATIVGGGTVAVEQTARQHAHRATLHLAAASTATSPLPSVRPAQAPASARVVAFSAARSGDDQRHESTSGGDRRAEGRNSGESGSGDSGSGDAVSKGGGSSDGERSSHGSGDSGSGDTGSRTSGSGDSGSRESGGSSGDGGSSGRGTSGGGDRTETTSSHGGVGTTETTSQSETKDGSKSGEGSGDESKSGDGSGSDDHHGDSTTTTTTTTTATSPTVTTPAPTALPVVTTTTSG